MMRMMFKYVHSSSDVVIMWYMRHVACSDAVIVLHFLKIDNANLVISNRREQFIWELK